MLMIHSFAKSNSDQSRLTSTIGARSPRQINKIECRGTALEHELPRKTVAAKEIDAPDQLYRSYHPLKTIGGKATDQEVCTRSGRARSGESSELNILVTLGLAIKYRAGRNVIFQLSNLEV